MLNLVENYDRHLNLQAATKKNIPSVHIKHVAWSHPQEDCIKVNVDGSLLCEVEANSCSGIDRDHNENFCDCMDCESRKMYNSSDRVMGYFLGSNLVSQHGFYMNLLRD